MSFLVNDLVEVLYYYGVRMGFGYRVKNVMGSFYIGDLILDCFRGSIFEGFSVCCDWLYFGF